MSFCSLRSSKWKWVFCVVLGWMCDRPTPCFHIVLTLRSLFVISGWGWILGHFAHIWWLVSTFSRVQWLDVSIWSKIRQWCTGSTAMERMPCHQKTFHTRLCLQNYRCCVGRGITRPVLTFFCKQRRFQPTIILFHFLYFYFYIFLVLLLRFYLIFMAGCVCVSVGPGLDRARAIRLGAICIWRVWTAGGRGRSDWRSAWWSVGGLSSALYLTFTHTHTVA